MMKTLIVCLLMVALMPLALVAKTTPDDIKARVAKIGTGEKARVKVKLKNGTKIEGYVSEAKDDNFTVRDSKTDAPTTIAYAEVEKVDKKKGNGKLIAILAGAGAAVVVGLVLLRTFGCDGGAQSGGICR